MLDTGSGFWSPLIWVIAIGIAFLVAYILRSFGNKDYKEKTDQTQAFLSGNPEYEKDQMHVKAGNVYWGFLKTFNWIYNYLLKMHNGNVSDYVLWFVVVLAILFILVGVI